MLTPSHRQEALSRAYVQAVVARAGMTYGLASQDYGIDLVVHDVERVGRRRRESGFRIDVQLKSTTLARLSPAGVNYMLDARTYEYLRDVHAGNPRILVVLGLPRRESDWCHQTETGLTLRRCAYWLSLRGLPSRTNSRAVQVSIPRANQFSARQLRGMMNRVKSGGLP
jgi:hypothetical protein